jgi:hypothetical protein
MIFLLLSVVLAAIVVAIPKVRHRIAFTGFSRFGIPRGDFSITRERSEQSTTPSPVKQFLIVMLPDGTIVTPRVPGPTSHRVYAHEARQRGSKRSAYWQNS